MIFIKDQTTSPTPQEVGGSQ